MRSVPLNRKVLLNRLSEIERDYLELGKFRHLTLKEFSKGVHFAVAEHYLRRALEATFDAGNHILSRLPLAPGQRPETYKTIALALGRYKIVSEAFAQGPLQEMAGYRNRLIHFYDEITPEELHEIIQFHLEDLDTFAKALRKIVLHPTRIGLRIQ
ncbi:MAG: DUF86 domain-containing protein [Candidatus Omnitrophica bacterium]|nr:DUF86 domain-containing protein [Candidatus Omnitrophota bacterium]